MWEHKLAKAFYAVSGLFESMCVNGIFLFSGLQQVIKTLFQWLLFHFDALLDIYEKSLCWHQFEIDSEKTKFAWSQQHVYKSSRWAWRDRQQWGVTASKPQSHPYKRQVEQVRDHETKKHSAACQSCVFFSQRWVTSLISSQLWVTNELPSIF